MKKVSQNLIFVTGAEILNPLIGFLIFAYLARILEVNLFGKINFAQAVFSYGLLLTNLGLPTLGTREIARVGSLSQNPSPILSSILGLRLSLSVVAFILLSIVTLLLPKENDTKLLIILYGLSLFAGVLIIEWFYQGIEKMEYLTLSRLVTSLVYLLFIFTFVKTKESFYLVPVGFLASNIINMLFLLGIYRKKFGKLQLKFDIKKYQDLLKLALPIGLASIFIQFSQYLTPILLSFLKGDSAVGYFSVAYKLVFFIGIIDRVFSINALPIISRYYAQESPRQLQTLFNRLQRLILIIILPVIFGGIVLSKEIVNLVYGTNYSLSIPVFRVLMLYFGFTMLVSLYSISLISQGKEPSYAWAIGLGTLTNIIINPLLILIFGTNGSAIAIVTAEFVTLYSLIKRQGSRFSLTTFIKPLIASCLMSVFLLLFSNITIILKLLGGIAIYFLSLRLMQGISIKDLRAFQ